jgi:hypothetical protein
MNDKLRDLLESASWTQIDGDSREISGGVDYKRYAQSIVTESLECAKAYLPTHLWSQLRYDIYRRLGL